MYLEYKLHKQCCFEILQEMYYFERLNLVLFIIYHKKMLNLHNHLLNDLLNIKLSSYYCNHIVLNLLLENYQCMQVDLYLNLQIHNTTKRFQLNLPMLYFAILYVISFVPIRALMNNLMIPNFGHKHFVLESLVKHLLIQRNYT